MNTSASYIMKSIGMLAGLILSLSPAAARAQESPASTAGLVEENPIIRVLIVDSVTSMCAAPKTVWQVRTLTGKTLCELKADEPVTIILTGGELRLDRGARSKAAEAASDQGGGAVALGRDPVVLESAVKGGVLGIPKVPYGVGWWWESAEDRLYEGRIEVRPAGNGKFIVVAVLPLEDYLRGVVPPEIGADSPLEAQCAQAVAARSAAALALTSQIYAGPHYNICSDVACQAFSGVTKCTALSDAAVTATRGLVLMFDGKPVSAYYASNCGGFTEDIRNVWPDRASDRAYWNTARFDGEGTCARDLAKEEDARKWIDDSPEVFCNPSISKVPEWSKRNFRWTREVSADELTSFVARTRDIGRVLQIRPLKRGPSGRLIEAEFRGENGALRVGPELAIRQVFNPPLKSAVFVADVKGDPARPAAFIIKGAGWGHGVGMCQTGAIGMANAGKTCLEILKHYYPNAAVKKLY